MMNATDFNESENGLQSQFAALRALPIAPLRALLPGLTARYFFGRSAVALGPLIFPLAFLVLSIPIVLLMAVKDLNAKQPKREIAVARVLQIERINDPENVNVNGQNRYFVKYRFETKGRTYQSTALAPQTNAGRDYDALKTGDELPINYPVGDPTRSSLQPIRPDSEFPPVLFLFFPLFILLFFFPMAAPTLRLWWQARRLVQTGHLCNGRIVWIHSPLALGAGIGEFRVHYEFPANGEIHTGQMRCNNLWLVQHLPPNAPIVVAYDAAQPKRSIFLEPFVA